jgi:hypothetical protein
MPDLAKHLRGLPERQGEPPWPGDEYVKGWGMFGLPFDSGHVLALFPGGSDRVVRQLPTPARQGKCSR